MNGTCGAVGPYGNGCVKLAWHQVVSPLPCESYDGRRWCGFCRKEQCQHVTEVPLSQLDHLWKES